MANTLVCKTSIRRFKSDPVLQRNLMIVINFWAGPGAGKSTMAMAITAHLKRRGMNAEFVGEVAKDFVYQRRPLDNQVYVMAKQYARLRNLSLSGCDVAVCDSPLRLALVYAAGQVDFYKEFEALVLKLDAEFTNYNIWIDRVKPFNPFGRTQKHLSEAAAVDVLAKSCGPFDLEVSGDEYGESQVIHFLNRQEASWTSSSPQTGSVLIGKSSSETTTTTKP